MIGYLQKIASACFISVFVIPAYAIVDGIPASPGSSISGASVELVNAEHVLCSAVLVGTNVMLTAAHCLSSATDMTVRIGSVSSRIIACKPFGTPPAPPAAAIQQRWADVTACVLSNGIDRGTPAVITEQHVSAGDTVVISGLGCNTRGGADREFGHLRLARVLIEGPQPDMDRVLRTASVGPAACFGDSGGGVYNSDGPNSQLVGVIIGGDTEGRTLILEMQPFKMELVGWAKTHGGVICGSGGHLAPCAAAHPQPGSVDRVEILSANILSATPTPLPVRRISAAARQGETVIDVYSRVCGTDSTQAAVTSTLMVTSGLDATRILSKDEPVTLPACAERAANPATPASGPATVVDRTLRPRSQPIFSLATSDPEGSCDGPDSDVAYPYDALLLLDVLRMDHHLPRNPTTAYILIADSGLEQSGHGVFPRELFAAFTGNWEDFADQMRPIVTDAEAISHGTEVASVALGGPTFAFTQAYSEEPRVKLLVQRIYQQSGSDVINDTDLFQDVVQHAGDFSGTIVNVSLRSTAKIPAIATEADNSKSSLLFVVAAGNQGKELDPEGAPKEATYPALYGGDARARLITVAALDAKAKLWAHSNWSPLLVDIAAPGCYIPVITASANSTRFRDDVRSGTSLAAPLVSFAAALVRSETSMSGDRLKRRILVSADLTPGDLSTKVIDGRRLDIAKAVAVTTDIVETKDGLHFGTARFFQGPTELHDGQKLGLKCQKVSNLTLKVESLLKFARYGGTTADPRFRIYYRKDGDPNPNALFESDLCTLPTDWLIKFSDYPDGIQRTVDFLSLIDYVERHRN